MSTTPPAWLTAAETDREQAAGANALFHQQQAEKHAAAINATLAQLGIDPLVSARVERGSLVPALLLARDPEHEHYGVYAGWSDTSEQPSLLVTDWESPGHRFHDPRYSRLLNRAADVLDAREQGPRPEPEPPRDFRADALRSIASLRVDHVGADAAAVAEAVNGLTAAVLHLAAVTAAKGTTA
jgi:hypothetical protein